MPEGPSIVILRESVALFKGKTILSASGNSTKVNFSSLEGLKVIDFLSWGKHFLICCEGSTLRIHFMLFGSYRINEKKVTPPRLSLVFDNGELNFYACSVLPMDQSELEAYDWTADVMNPDWDGLRALDKIKSYPNALICDILLDQQIFSGVGNIIKNEVLYRVGVHPESIVSNIPEAKLKEIISEAVVYSFDFLKWKKEFTLKKHWLAHTKRVCMIHDLPIVKSYTGKNKRRSFYCEACQIRY